MKRGGAGRVHIRTGQQDGPFAKIFALTQYTVVENIRNKIYYVLALFCAILLGCSVIFSMLGGDMELRLIHDLGIISIEIFALLVTIYSAVNLILEEIKSRTIYLVMMRPISRAEYILGRYFGMTLAVCLGVAIMAFLHILLLLAKGWALDPAYIAVVAGVMLKVMLVSALALFWSVFSTSPVASVVFTAFFWILGHFGEEMRFLSQKIGPGVLKIILKVIFYIIPNFQYMNFRDRFVVEGVFSLPSVGLALFYTVGYAGICLCLAIWVFSRKEF